MLSATKAMSPEYHVIQQIIRVSGVQLVGLGWYELHCFPGDHISRVGLNPSPYLPRCGFARY